MIEYKVKVHENGSKHWYLNGKFHREDGPAVEGTDGSKFWYLNGKFHREDGPAIEYSNGNKSWFLNDKELTEDEFNQRTQSCDGKIIEIEGKQYKLNLVK